MTGTPSTGVEIATASMVASARREAERLPPARRWAVLSLYAEIHRRAAAELTKLAQQEGKR